MPIWCCCFQDVKLEIKGAGESGDCVMTDMPRRLNKLLHESEAAGQHYDWVLILGGINDILGKGRGYAVYPQGEPHDLKGGGVGRGA